LSAARVALASGSDAEALFERACTVFEASGMPFETALARLGWAEALDAAHRAIASEACEVELKRWRGPFVTQVIYAEHTVKMSKETVDVLGLWDSGMTMVQIPGATHFFPITHPNETAKAIVDFTVRQAR
jgi:hypothetical protein